MLGHQTASNAQFTSRLIITAISPAGRITSTNYLKARPASQVILRREGILNFVHDVAGKTWWINLIISSLSKTFSPVLRIVKDKNFRISFPGLTMGKSLAVFHLFGKNPFRRQVFCMAVIYFGKI